MKNYKNLVSNLIFYFLIFIGLYRFTNEDLKFLLDFLKESNRTNIFLILIFKVLMVFSSSAQHKILYKEFNLKLSNFENFKLVVNSMMGNFFSFAKHGSIYKARYLNEKFDFEYRKFLKFFLVLNFMSIALNSLIIILYLFWEYKIFYIFFVLSITAIFLYVYKNKTFKLNKLSLNSLLKLFLLQTLSLTFYCISLYFLSKTIGLNFDILQILIFSTVVSVSILISITPNSIGIREFLLFMTSSILIVSNDKIILMSLLDRLTDAFFLVLLFLIVNITGVKNK